MAPELSSEKTRCSPLSNASVTLDNWLRWNFLDPSDPLDAELLEVIPEEFYDEYLDILRFHNEYEQKFEKRKS